MDAASSLGAAERFGDRRAADGVEVTEKENRPTAAPTAVDENVHAAGCELVDLDAKSLRRGPLGDDANRGRLAGPAGIAKGFTDSVRTSAAVSSASSCTEAGPTACRS